MADKKEYRLNPTKSEFVIEGKIRGISNEKAYRYGESGKTGLPWHSIRFGIQTSPTNTVYVELMGSVQENARIFDSKNKKNVQVPWDDRNNLPAGHTILDTRIALIKGNTKTIGYMTYDAIEVLRDNLQDGMSVKISGVLEANKWTTGEGEVRKTTKYSVKRVHVIEDIDFDAPNFKEQNEFMQEMVIIDTDYDAELDKLYLTAYVIMYGDKFEDTQFVVDGKSNPEFLKNVKKILSPGDFIQTVGTILNAAETTEVDEEDEGDAEVNLFGGKTTNTFKKKSVIKTTLREMRVEGIPVYEKQKYNIEKDFVVDEAEESYNGTRPNNNPFRKDTTDGFGGRGADTAANTNDDDDVPF